jgi:hypothetical protein
MVEIIEFSDLRNRQRVKDGYLLWQKHFGVEFTIGTRLSDLSHPILANLAEPGEDSMYLLNAMIIGFSGLGTRTPFEHLDSPQQCRVIDIQLFLADQIRFEMLHRLGWLSHFPCGSYSFFHMVKEFDTVSKDCRDNPPELATSYKDFSSYAKLVDRDKQVFIRRLLPSALESFRKAFLS